MATIQGVYVALFGRPADPTGLAYFNGVTNNGANLTAIGDLASTQEYKDRFAGQNNTQIVNSIYQSLFGRDAEAAGLNFFVDALNKGTLNIKNIAIAILDGAQGTDKTISANKVAAADLYTKSLDTPTEIGSYTGNTAAAQGRAFISGVTTTVPNQAAVDAAITTMVGAGAAGSTIALTDTAGADNLSLSSSVTDNGVAKFTTDRNDTINATAADSLNATDKIDGGLGNDTVNAVLTGNLELNGTGNVGNFKNIENLNVAANTNPVALNVTAVSGLQTLIHDGTLDGATANTALTVTGVALTTAVGVSGAVAGASSFTFKDADGSADAASLKLATASGGTITVVGAETLNVSNTGTSVSTVADTTLKAATVAGAGDLTLTLTAATTLETVDATAFTGKFSFDGTLNQGLKTITGGTGTDAITIDLNHTNDITINTGAGADIITVNAGGASATKALVLTGGADADQFVFQSVGNITATAAAATTNADFIKTLITISDFDKSADAIKVNVAGAASSAAARDVLLTAEQSQISGASDLLAATKIAASYTSLNTASTFQYGADTYIFVNNADAGATGTIDATDTLIKVTGVAVADLTASNFQLIAV